MEDGGTTWGKGRTDVKADVCLLGNKKSKKAAILQETVDKNFNDEQLIHTSFSGAQLSLNTEALHWRKQRYFEKHHGNDTKH